MSTLITPNLPEAQSLSFQTNNVDKLGDALLKLGAQAVLIKGGHSNTPFSNDLFLDQHGHRSWLIAKRIPTHNTHGTGCTLSAAICAYIAKGASTLAACKNAKIYLHKAIEASQQKSVGKGHGPVHHFHHLWKPKLSQQAWQASEAIITAIKAHPFIQTLATRELSETTFTYYIEQDSIYLKSYIRALAMIAAKVPTTYISDFLTQASNILIVEKNTICQTYKNQRSSDQKERITPATLSYTSYLLHLCANEPVEVAIAGILPCFWIYREVGTTLAQSTNTNHPYRAWIQTYSSNEFSTATDQIIRIFDQLAEQSSQMVREKMLKAFHNSAHLEWHFWNDAFHHAIFDKVST